MEGMSDNDVIDEDPVEENNENQVVDEEKNDQDFMLEEEDPEIEEEDNDNIEEEEEEEENDDIEEEEDNDHIEEEDNGDEQEEKTNEEDAIGVAKNEGGTEEEEAETVKGEGVHNNEEEENEEEVNDDNNAQEEKTNGEDAIVVTEKNEGGAEEETKIVKSEENTTQNVGKAARRNRKKKVTQGAANNVVSKERAANNVISEDKNKPDSSKKKETSKKVESMGMGMGMIFMCTSKTKKDCYRYKLLGLPARKKDLVEKIYKGMSLFLFDLDLRLMYGIYKAAGPGGSNIVPKAFKSAFPSQVRFTILEDCLPLAEEKFKDVIKENYYSRNKFHCELTSEQVKKLCKLFVSAGKGSTLRKPSKNLAERITCGVQNRSIRRGGPDVNPGLRQRGQDEERGRKRKVKDEESSRKRKGRDEERGRKRKPTDEERGRKRKDGDEERGRKRLDQHDEGGPPFRQDQRNHERLVIYTTEVFPSQVAPRHGSHQLPTATPSPLYGYERTLERSPLRSEAVLEHRGLRRVDLEPRHHDEASNRDPCVSYREREALSYRVPMYSTAPQPEYYAQAVLPVAHRPVIRKGEPRMAGLRGYYQPEPLPVEYLPVRKEVKYLPLRREVEYRSSADFPTQYHSSVGLPADYRASRSLLGEYHAAGISTEGFTPTGLSNGYRRADPAEYRSSAGALHDYHSQRSTHRY